MYQQLLYRDKNSSYRNNNLNFIDVILVFGVGEKRKEKKHNCKRKTNE